MASLGGAGRGGRGAQLAQLLSQQVRKPGDTQDNAPAQQVAVGAPQAQQPAVQVAAAQNFVQPPAPAAQALATATIGATAPLPLGAIGRGARLQQLMQSTSAEASPTPSERPPSASGDCESVRAKTTVTAVDPLGPCCMQPLAAALPVSSQPGSEGDAKKPSYQQRMLTRLANEKPPVISRGSSGQTLPVGCNYIALRCRNQGVYQYAVAFSPDVDSLFMRHRLIDEAADVLGPTKSFDGRILFLPLKLPNQDTMITKPLPTDGSPIKIIVKLVAVLPASSCLQLYNITFRKALSKLQMCQVSRDYYLPQGAVAIREHNLEVWPGYITAIDEYEGGLLMLTDVKHKVLRTQTVYHILMDIIRNDQANLKDRAARMLIGSIVLTRYNNRTYRIDDIDWGSNPSSSFTNSAGKTETYVEYYRRSYNKEVQDTQQPLLVHRQKARDIPRGRGGKRVTPGQVIALIPEFCFMTGLTDDMRNDFKVMKDLAVHTRVPPEKRRQSLRKLTHSINSTPEARAELERWGLVIDDDIMQLDGRLLPPEKIILGGDREITGGLEADWGRAVTNSPVITSVDLVHWMIVVTMRDQSKAVEFTSMYRKCGNDMGISVQQPLMCVIANDRTDTYLKEIKEKLMAQCQLVVIIFPTKRDDRYNAVKKLCCVESPVPSQVIIAKTIGDPKKLRSCTQKIALQINVKLGGELWAVKIPMKGVMMMGIDTYHEKSRNANSYAGIVCSINERCTRWYSRVCCQNPHEELVNGLKPAFVAAIRKYYEVNHALPQRVFIFRDGVGDGQLRYTAEFEVPQLTECFANFGAEYQPKVAVLIVQKRINQRIFAIQGREMDNPPPGTIVDHTVTRRNWADFFLVSQHVRQGTVSPTHYVIIHDSSGLPVDRLQCLTYKMTHMYYNWPGTVRVPAPCQYAHKLAYLVGQNLRREPNEALADRLFFL